MHGATDTGIATTRRQGVGGGGCWSTTRRRGAILSRVDGIGASPCRPSDTGAPKTQKIGVRARRIYGAADAQVAKNRHQCVGGGGHQANASRRGGNSVAMAGVGGRP